MIVRDRRRPGVFGIDNEFVDTAARECGGAYAAAVYMALCRHADNELQNCWPSEERVAEKMKMSSRQVRRVINSLSQHGLITIERQKTEKGYRNVYTLLDRSLWQTGPTLFTAEENEDSGAPPQPPANNGNLKAVIAYFLERAEAAKGFKPKVMGKDGALLKAALASYPLERVRNIIDFFLSTEKSDSFLSLSAALSAATYNTYQLEWQKRKWQWGDQQEPPVDKEWWL